MGKCFSRKVYYGISDKEWCKEKKLAKQACKIFSNFSPVTAPGNYICSDSGEDAGVLGLRLADHARRLRVKIFLQIDFSTCRSDYLRKFFFPVVDVNIVHTFMIIYIFLM